MCGIFTVFSLGQPLHSDVEHRVSRALESMKHRGPDARGSFVDPDSQFALGHVRLSVIDVAAASNQPFFSDCQRYCIVFNGEIYNYIELRDKLRAEGVTFRTESDTEVLLHALTRWGTDAIHRLNGDWAFVYVDVVLKKAIVCRDRWGAKPIHVYSNDGLMIISSEAKGIHAYLGRVLPPDHDAIGQFLKYGVGGENTLSWFKGIERFPQACYQEIDLRKQSAQCAAPVAYWAYPTERSIHSLPEAVAQFDRLLTDAIRIRLRSDVPLGLSLSGGLDSATIAWIVSERCQQHLQAFTAWFEPVERSELAMARMIADRFQHPFNPIAEVDPSGTVQVLRDCIRHLEAGHHASAIVPYLNICRAARKKLTVMIEGQGADELLAGYVAFTLPHAVDCVMRGKWKQAGAGLRNYVATKGWKHVLPDIVRSIIPMTYQRQADRWGSSQVLGPLAQSAQWRRPRALHLDSNNLSKALASSHALGLTSLLQIGDAVAMSVNLETRCPFLDYRLVEFAFRLDPDLLIRDGFGKYTQRCFSEHALPPELVWRKMKDGFTNSTIELVQQFVMTHGLPKKAVQFAIDCNLFRAKVNSQSNLQKLPPTVVFRIMSVMLWIETFYFDDSSVAHQVPKNAA